MITADLHSHTLYSHAKDTVEAMAAAAFAKGLAVFGFSEHSLRPAGYRYATDYQEKLAAGFPSYIEEVRAEQERYRGKMRVLLALEQDYIPAEEDFARAACAAQPFDYVIGGLHFQGHWGFDGSAAEWADLSPAACETHFARYYEDLERMARTGLFQIAAHPDLVKLFKKDAFHAWLEKPESLALVEKALVAMKECGMAMEVSSAALRKGLGEPYPAPPLMRCAASINLPISFGSDSHATGDVAFGFDELAAYAKSFGYTQSVWFEQRVMQFRSFI
ncbi:histidinol-phosphatase [Desulfovibrio sp. OttesenSCG-928-I05]|nr:histidinol-phosphatase [Desulfovibrio sp. OttesenSCG-928-I05]